MCLQASFRGGAKLDNAAEPKPCVAVACGRAAKCYAFSGKDESSGDCRRTAVSQVIYAACWHVPRGYGRGNRSQRMRRLRVGLFRDELGFA